MERAGTRDTEVLVQNSTADVVNGVPGDVWADVDTFYVSVEIRQPERVMRNGMSFDQEIARFRFDWSDGEILSRTMRIGFEGRHYEIRSIDRSSDTRKTVVVDAAVALSDSFALRESIDRRIREGIIVTVRRESFEDAPQDVPARALVEGYKADELVGGVNQGDRKITILASDVAALADGIVNGDIIILPDGEHLTALNVDRYTHRIGNNLIAYEMTGRGGG